MSETPNEALRRESWDKAFYCWATYSIFNERIQKTRRKIQLLSFVALAVPLIVGGLALSIGVTHWIIFVAGVVGLVQLVVSLWALVSKWDDSLIYSLKSASDNSRLSAEFQELAKSPPDVLLEFKNAYEKVKIRNDAISESDNQQVISNKEMRRGHRAGLRQFQIQCTGCKNVPNDLTSTKCPVCGKFRWYNRN